MKDFNIIPSIVEYKTYDEFADEFGINEDDLIITNEYIFNVSRNEKQGCKLLFQEQYGMGEPTDVMVNKIIKDLKEVDYNRIIAIGGGTVIDIAKIIAVAGRYSDVNIMYDDLQNLSKCHKLIIIPTTCGTGSEVTNISVVNRTKIGTKQGLVSKEMYADYAVLISQFIETLPYKVFATSSLDALVHAIESFLSPKATYYSKLFSKEAIDLLLESYIKVINDQSISGVSAYLLRASNYAGIAFANAGCGTVHAMSYAFGGKYHVAHGESNYELLMAVLKYYEKYRNEEVFLELKDIFSQYIPGGDILDELDKLLNKILERKPMTDYGMTIDDVEEFSKSTISNQQRLLLNSYIPMTESSLKEIYQMALY